MSEEIKAAKEEVIEKSAKIKEKYKVLFCRQDVGDKIQMKYWLSEGFDPDYPRLAREINSVVEPLLISLETESEKEFDRSKYRPVKFERTERSSVKAPPIMSGVKVIEVVVDKTTEEKFSVRKVWNKFDVIRFSASVDMPFIQEKAWKPRTVAAAAKKWKTSDKLGTTIGDTLDQDTTKLVHTLFKIDPVAIAADVNKAASK